MEVLKNGGGGGGGGGGNSVSISPQKDVFQDFQM